MALRGLGDTSHTLRLCYKPTLNLLSSFLKRICTHECPPFTQVRTRTGTRVTGDVVSTSVMSHFRGVMPLHSTLAGDVHPSILQLSSCRARRTHSMYNIPKNCCCLREPRYLSFEYALDEVQGSLLRIPFTGVPSMETLTLRLSDPSQSSSLNLAALSRVPLAIIKQIWVSPGHMQTPNSWAESASTVLAVAI